MTDTQEQRVDRHPLFHGYLVAAAVLVVGYFALPWPAAHPLYRLPVDALAAIATAIGIRRYRPSPAYPWKVLLVGQIMGLGADCIWAYHQLTPNAVKYPGPEDAAFLMTYAVLGLGLWLLIRNRTPGSDRAMFYDVSIFVWAVGLVFWVTFVDSAIDSHHLTLWAQAVSVAFPLLDLVLLAFVFRLFIGRGARNSSSTMLGFAFLATLIADTLYATLSSVGKYHVGNPLDAGWMLLWLLLGAAALHPDMRSACEPQRSDPDGSSVRRIWILASALFLVPLALVIETLNKGSIDVAEFVIASVGLIVLFVARLNLLVKELKHTIAELQENDEVLRASLKQRKRLENELTHQASHDSLTCLPNRVLLFDRLSQVIVGTRDTHKAPAVMFIDLDDFKVINDRYGHNVGDEMLVSVAKNLIRCLRPYDSAARIGGDEFAVLLPDVESEADALRVAQRVQSSITSRVELSGGALLALTCSIGVALGSSPGDLAEDLLKRADIAMYAAKGDGKNKVVRYQPEMSEALFSRIDLKDAITDALQTDGFEVAYQPIVALESGRITGVEALVRWNHPDRGTISPAEFIPIAEESGLIQYIDRSVMAKAAAELADWRSIRGAENLFLSCNVSPELLCQSSFGEFVGNVLSTTGLPAESLMIEITERTLAEDIETVVASLSRIRALGAQIAVDDFGTGYSSLAYLKRFPLDVLKIDKSFIDNIALGIQDAALAKTVVGLSDALGLSVIAEGVERESQADVLIDIGCPQAQGYLFGPPLDPQELTKTLVENLRTRRLPTETSTLV